MSEINVRISPEAAAAIKNNLKHTEIAADGIISPSEITKLSANDRRKLLSIIKEECAEREEDIRSAIDSISSIN